MAGGWGEGLLTAEGFAAVDAAGPVEILAGIPALNHARCIAHVLEAVAAGLAAGFPGQKTAVLVADAGSQDGTLDAVRAWKDATASAVRVQCVRLSGPPHRGRAILAILAAAQHLTVRGCAFVDADLTGLAPAGVERLLEPVLGAEADYVSPAYTRTVTEGTLTTNLLAPMTGALYGKRIQQLIGGCAGLSGGFISRLLEDNARESDLAAHGVEVRLATAALASGHRVVETHLGRKRVDPGLAQPDLAGTLVGVVGPLFGLMDAYRAVWQDARGSVPVPQRGGPPGLLPEVGEIHVDRMVRAFGLGLKDLLPVWEQIMPEERLAQLYPLGLLAADEFRFPAPVWARVVYDFAVAHHERRLARDHLLRALTPLYLGRVAAFLLEVGAGTPARVPGIVERLGRAFEAEKETLSARWR